MAAGAAALLAALAAVHFHGVEIFSRALLDLDDSTYIAPLGQMDLATYLTVWLPGQDNFAYPLRDFSFWLDFRLSELTGIQTFWITNFLIFAATLLIVLRLYRRILPVGAVVCLLLMALIAFHPLNVQVVQWLSIRKHLLVALFLALASTRALTLYAEQREPAPRDWGVMFSGYGASLLCFPSGVLWIAWPMLMFRRSLAQNWLAGLLVIAAAAAMVGGSYWFAIDTNPEYARAQAGLLQPENLARYADVTLRSLGRGMFNLLAPAQLALYYDPDHRANVVGLLLLAGTVLLAGWLLLRVHKRNPEQARLAGHCLLGSALLFVPQFFIVLNYTGFVWADRYLYLPLPYLVAGVTLLITGSVKPASQTEFAGHRIAFLIGGCAAAAAAAWLALVSVRDVPLWRDDRTLMDACFAREGSAKCLVLGIESAFTDEGCPGVLGRLADARNYYPRMDDAYHRPLRAVLPFYDGACTVLAGPGERRAQQRELSELRKIYDRDVALSFANVLAALDGGNLDWAYQIATATYLRPGAELELTYKTAAVLLGQTQALCELAPPSLAADCAARREAFTRLASRFYPRPDMTAWARAQTLLIYSPGPG